MVFALQSRLQSSLKAILYLYLSHQVLNLEDTISINHNWFNGTNVISVARALIQELRLGSVSRNFCRYLRIYF